MTPVEVVTDKAAAYPILVDQVLPAVWHRTEQYANNHIECDYGRLKVWLRPMRRLKQDHSARVVVAGHALVQYIRRGHYELAVEALGNRRVALAFDDHALAIELRWRSRLQPAAGWPGTTAPSSSREAHRSARPLYSPKEPAEAVPTSVQGVQVATV